MSDVSTLSHTENWTAALRSMNTALRAVAQAPLPVAATKPYDGMAVAGSVGEFMLGLAAQPQRLFEVQAKAFRQWGDFWFGSLSPKDDETPPPVEIPRSDRRFGDAAWRTNPYFRNIRDTYLIASDQLRSMANLADGIDPRSQAMVKFLLDQYLNAVAPSNFAATNPEVVRRIAETGGANLVAGFANLLADVAAGKGVVERRAPAAFKLGENIAATPGSVVFQNHLFQLIQYDPVTPQVHAAPLLYVPPLVNKYYMIDLQPKSSLVRWLVEEGRTVFAISWINPDDSHRDCGVEHYVRDGIVEALGAVERATGTTRTDLFSFCLGGTLTAIAASYLTATGQADRLGSLTLIGAMVDFSDMREWSAFVHEAHLDALDKHLEKRGFIESHELQQLFSAVRANDLIWSSVVSHYLLDREAPPSDILHWFQDGSRIPQAFLKSYNRSLLFDNALSKGGAFSIDGAKIDLAVVKVPVMLIALRDDHVSAWEAVYAGARLFGGPATFVLAGSGHNAGVVNPPAANKHGYWTSSAQPDSAADWLAGAEKNVGSWWPMLNAWLDEVGSAEMVAARAPGSGKLKAIEPAPGSYVTITH